MRLQVDFPKQSYFDSLPVASVNSQPEHLCHATCLAPPSDGVRRPEAFIARKTVHVRTGLPEDQSSGGVAPSAAERGCSPRQSLCAPSLQGIGVEVRGDWISARMVSMTAAHMIAQKFASETFTIFRSVLYVSPR